jgi:predicted secreted protein
MKQYQFVMSALAAIILSWTCGAAVEFKNGTAFALDNVPKELVVERRAGESVRFSLEENQSTGFKWEVESNTNECEVALERRAHDRRTACGASGKLNVTVTSRIYTPSRVEFRYRRPWEKNTTPWKSMRLIVYTVGEAKDPRYPKTPVNLLLEKECARRGITLVDWHLHIRGGMTSELAYIRETNSFVRSTAMENHGREWEIYDNARLRDFAARARKANPKMPVGIQVNDRDWFEKIDAETRAQFDYILADSMIMGKLPSGRDNRLWMVKEIPDPDKWMEEYFAHVMKILGEPISIYANPTYLPTPIAAQYDRLWTEERMRTVIAKCIENGIAIEIQAESAFPRPAFLRLAKEMGAKFSFGTNNFDPGPKDLSKWLEAIVWLDLGPSDIWTPPFR